MGVGGIQNKSGCNIHRGDCNSGYIANKITAIFKEESSPSQNKNDGIKLVNSVNFLGKEIFRQAKACYVFFLNSRICIVLLNHLNGNFWNTLKKVYTFEFWVQCMLVSFFQNICVPLPVPHFVFKCSCAGGGDVSVCLVDERLFLLAVFESFYSRNTCFYSLFA